MNHPDPVMADLARYDREQADGQRRMEEAEAERPRLVDDFIADERSKNQTTLLDYLADLAGGDAEFLHALQRGDIGRMQKLFRDAIDVALGDELVEKRAQELQDA